MSKTNVPQKRKLSLGKVHFDPKDPKSRSRTKQEHKERSDINNIMKKYHSTGVLPQISDIQAQFGDFMNAESYYASAVKVREVEENFKHLPPHVRDHFENNVANLFDFLEKEDNQLEGVNLGLFKRPEPKFDENGAIIHDEYYPAPKPQSVAVNPEGGSNNKDAEPQG